MIRRVLVPAVALLALAGCTSGSGAAQADGGNRYVAGDGKTVEYPAGKRVAAPAVSGTTLDGGTFDLAAHHGHVVVVNFWAEWCAPCVEESAALESVYKSTKDSGVVFVGVNTRDVKSKAQAFEKGRLTYPSLYDQPGRVAMDFRDVTSALPTTVVIDKQGRVAAAVHAAVTEQALADLVRKIAAET